MTKRPSTSGSTRIKQPAQQERALIYLAGERDLVDEYARLCESKGFDTVVHANEPRKPSARPEGHPIPKHTSLALELTNTNAEAKRENIERFDRDLPPTCAILTSSLTVTATEQSTWIKHRHRLMGFGALPGMSEAGMAEVAPTVFTPRETLDVVRRFFGSLGIDIELVQDRVGLVFPRLMCQMVNEAAYVLQDEVATPADVDAAMQLGAAFPIGPLAWADRIGFHHVLAILRALQADLDAERYRICPLVKQLGQTGRWWEAGSGELPTQK